MNLSSWGKILTLVLFIAILATNVSAQGGWAPGIEKKDGPAAGSGLLMGVRFGFIYGKYDVSEVGEVYEQLGELFGDEQDAAEYKRTTYGIKMEAAPRLARADLSTSLALAFEGRMIITGSVLSSIKDSPMGIFHQTEGLFTGQVCPAARLVISDGGMKFLSPYFGIGPGLAFHINDPFSNTFDYLWGWQLGVDIELGNFFGVGIALSKSSISYSGTEEYFGYSIDGVYDFSYEYDYSVPVTSFDFSLIMNL